MPVSSGFIDLHSHWVAGIDDGVKTPDEGRALLTALKRAGFDRVIATPHMRPGMFDNSRELIAQAFERTTQAIGATAEGSRELPAIALGSEHFFDDMTFTRLVEGKGLPYPGGKAVLVELGTGMFPARLPHRLQDLRRQTGLVPVLAHPERYEPVWKDIHVLEPLLDVGTVLLLDVAALDGKYGKAPRKAAQTLLDEGYYYAACSDAHKAADVEAVREGIEALFESQGEEEANFLLRDGPLEILEGRIRN